MSTPKLHVDDEFLKKSPHPIAEFYRVLLFAPTGMTWTGMIKRFSESSKPQIEGRLRRLIAEGWVLKLAELRKIIGKGRAEHVYIALHEQKKLPPIISMAKQHLTPFSDDRINVMNARRRMTALATTAAEARRSGLTFTMSRALDRIETEIREIRELLPGSRARPSINKQNLN